MNAPTTLTKKLGQVECTIGTSGRLRGRFEAYSVIDGDRTLILEGRVPSAIASDEAMQEAVHVLAKAVMERMVAVLMPGTTLTVTRSRKEQG